MTNKKYDIHTRIFVFVIEVIRITRDLPRNDENKVIVGQILRSVTSIGANAEEADGVSSKKDFLHCFTIVRKEGKETLFWLKLIGELNPSIKNQVQRLIIECCEIVAIISKILINARKK